MKKVKFNKSIKGKLEIPLGGYGFVIGNGTSRKDIDVKPLMDWGTVYACNWFFREEFAPHVLVCSDEPITRSVYKLFPNYAKRNWLYTWYPKPGSGAKKATTPEKFAAGPMAVELACNKHKKQKVFMIGIDFFGFGSNNKENNGTVNNLYAGKKHYVKGDDVAAPTYRNWQRRFEWILRNYPQVEIYHVNPFDGKSPERLRGFHNFHQITYDNLIDHLENEAPLVDILEKTEEDVAVIQHINEDDVRAVIERQFSGQENVIFKDIISPDEVLRIKTEVTREIMSNPNAANGSMAQVNILGFNILIPAYVVREGNIDRAARPEEIKVIHDKMQMERHIVTEAWRNAGFKGIKIQVQGVSDNPPPPPPPPPIGQSKNDFPPEAWDLPPPPPPPTVG